MSIKVGNPNFYHEKKRDRTRTRLTQMNEMGMDEVGHAQFGLRDKSGDLMMSGLHIEMVWLYSDKEFNDYLDWAIAKPSNYVYKVGKT